LNVLTKGAVTNNATHSFLPILGSLDQLNQVVQEHKITYVMIALNGKENFLLDRILDALKDEPVHITLVPDLYEYITLGCQLETFDNLAMIHINLSPLSGWGIILKRLMDIAIALISLILLIPFTFCIAIAIKLTSKGPLFFKQERMGVDGKLFEMLKFRSMVQDAEQQTGAIFATENDSRKTPVGNFLRKTSLDELPQFWNVLKGDMSIVGPRPERPFFVDQFKKQIPNYMLRHKVKSGITGWAQVNGWRGNTSLTERIACDLFYIRHWSLWLDAKIIWLTIWKGFINKNAY
jgi:Undecaprenyl-phosphate glucose phosphotransferase